LYLLVTALKGIAICLITLGTGTTLAWGQVAGPEVHDALKAGAWARVVIALREPNAPMDDRPRWNSEIGRVQKRVLASLTPSDFKATHQWASVSALAGEVSQSGLTKLLADPDVIRIDLDTGGRGALSVSVPLIQGDQMHDLGYTGNGVVVAVLDSGLQTDHPDLAGALIAEECFCTRDGRGCCPSGSTRQSGPGSAEDDYGHGTSVTGIIVSAGGVSSVGVAPGASIVAIKVLDYTNSFEAASQVISGLDWIFNNRPDVQVINMSLGTFAMFAGICDNATAFTMAFANAVNRLKNMGITIVASSGNEGSGTQMEAPACTANTIAVGAVYKADVGPVSCDSTTEADQVTCFTNSNSKLELMAPGAPIESIDCCNIGTSFASPHAAGGAALLLEANPTLTPDKIKAALRNSSVQVTDPKNGLTFPRINLLDALNAVSTP
jgi:subtilisin family serine protease